MTGSRRGSEDALEAYNQGVTNFEEGQIDRPPNIRSPNLSYVGHMDCTAYKARPGCPKPLDDTAPLTYRPQTAAGQDVPASALSRAPHRSGTSNDSGRHNEETPFVLLARLVLNSTPLYSPTRAGA
jgi:hypothetical protein